MNSMKAADWVKDDLEFRKKWLAENEIAYKQAIELLEDTTRVRGFLMSLREKLGDIISYSPFEDPPHAAVYVVASCRERVSGLFQDLDFIEEYEDRKESYIKAVKDWVDDDDDSETETTG
jgi:hypothetical protein